MQGGVNLSAIEAGSQDDFLNMLPYRFGRFQPDPPVG